MKLTLVSFFTAAIVVFVPFLAHSQDGTDFGYNAATASTSSLLASAMNNIVLQNTLPPSRRAPSYGDKAPNRSRQATPSNDTQAKQQRLTQQRPTQQRPAVSTSLSYRPDARLSQTVKSEFIARTRRNNPNAADAVATSLASINVGDIFSNYTTMANVPVRDPSSSMAIYTAIAWSIANGVVLNGNNPNDIARVQGLQKQLLVKLQLSSNMADMTIRQKLDEEFMILSIILDAGHDSARVTEGPRALADYSNGVSLLFKQQFGIDLRSMDLTANGLMEK
jgi:hypothetical protein